MKFSTTIQKDKIDSIAIGGFDGLHIAHQYLLSHLSPLGALIVIEKKAPFALTPDLVRCKYSTFPCIFLDFDAIKNDTAVEFITFLKKEFPCVQKVIIGYDFRFGKHRQGDAKLLKELYDGEIIVIEEQSIDGISIHSKEIKEMLYRGQISKANKLLGRPYEVSGEVISGQGLGKKELFATFNIQTGRFLLPKEGVYVTKTKIDQTWFPSVSFIGKRVSTDGEFSVETHILDKQKFDNVKNIDIAFYDFIRENRKFDTLELLKKQISKDIAQTKAFFH